MIEILPTCVPNSAGELSACVDSVRSFASCVHVDIDDGVFAPAVTWPYKRDGTFEEPELPTFPVEVHLMTEEPTELGLAFVRAGATRIVGHVEGFADKREIFNALARWKEAGAEVGLGLLYQTPFEVVEPFVVRCDVVHLMSIATVGTQGIPYVPEASERIAEFHRRFPDTLISVDGGVSEENIAKLVRAGARRFGVGSALFKATDPQAAYERLKALAIRQLADAI